MSAPTALYRRYRPDSFATVIGQEHVTAPLMTALDKNRVNHAYLFSGPRGCGKTTSARILARCLNCAQGPTSHPCGECDSCVELARGGAGSLDVIEIDAASHGGVDDARDLRERATFAPIRDRYKIFIIDEAHMVTSAGFNALLKIVEEPPEHIKFIFATTEPDKVIGTIRSRTHHYPFRLVPPEPLMAYLAQLCEQENVAVAPGVLSLVVRAGGGSVRDSLSVLDQLMAGASATGLDYDLAVDLLGYTHSSLLDDVVEALAASDSATVFKSVDRVIQTGHDPRRFVEDLLERFRDLIIVQAMPESAHAILRGTPDELIARMQTQAAQLGAAELSRAADVTNAAFNEMTGATSPRLHLELLGARLLLPGADSSTRGMATRLDQLERRLNYSGTPVAPAAEIPSGAPQQGIPAQSFPAPSTTPAPYDSAPGTPAGGFDGTSGSGGGLAAVRAQLARAKEAAGAEVAARHNQDPAQAPAAAPAQELAPQASASQVPSEQAAPAQQQVQPVQPNQQQPVQHSQQAGSGQQQAANPARTWDDLPTPSGNTGAPMQQPEPAAPASQATDSWTQAPQQNQQSHQIPPAQAPPAQAQPPAVTQAGPAAAAQAPGNPSGIEVIRRAWPEILTALRNIRMASWAMVNQNVVPQVFDGQELRVGLPSSGLIDTFANNGHLANLQQAINEVLGLTIQILPADGEAPKASAEPNPKVRTGNPSPQRGGNGSNAPAPVESAQQRQQPAPAQDLPSSAQAQSAPTASQDSWGLPVAPENGPVRAQPVAHQPVQIQAPDSTPAPARTPAPAPKQAPAPAPENSAAPVHQASGPSVAWDGPAEPGDSWGEPHPEFEPPADPYDSGSQYPPEDPYFSGGSAPTGAGFDASPGLSSTATSPAAPAAPPVHVPPKVSPISAWTTGWDAPAVEEPIAAPVAPVVPRRSELLAQQMSQQGTQQPAGETAQDWGVSLGQGNRNNVADPGWGNMSNAPDWAQDSPAGTTPADGAPTSAPTGSPATASAAETEAPVAAETPYNAALPVAGQPLGASSAYPTPAETPTPAASPTQPAALATAPDQEAPASNSAQSGERLSMYQRLANSSEAQAGRAQAPAVSAATTYVEDVPSPDDVTIEESGVVGQAAVERILGGVLVEERPLNRNA